MNKNNNLRKENDFNDNDNNNKNKKESFYTNEGSHEDHRIGKGDPIALVAKELQLSDDIVREISPIGDPTRAGDGRGVLIHRDVGKLARMIVHVASIWKRGQKRARL